ncbi:MAG: class I SAM-dependent methyltransferase [Armatimonadota bacterium]
MHRREFFDNLAEKWDDEESPDISVRLERVVTLADLHAGQRVLDVGTGTGVLVPHILQRVGQHGIVVALDISRGMLRQAKAKMFPSNVYLVLGDMHRAGLGSGAFDRVLCNAVFPHFEDRSIALQEVWRVLRPGGLMIISHPIGREAVNRLHSQYEAVAQDRVPTADGMQTLLIGMGWVQVEVIDEPDFYLAKAKKRLAPAMLSSVQVLNIF